MPRLIAWHCRAHSLSLVYRASLIYSNRSSYRTGTSLPFSFRSICVSRSERRTDQVSKMDSSNIFLLAVIINDSYCQNPISISMRSSGPIFCPVSCFHTNCGRSRLRWAPVLMQIPIRIPKNSKRLKSWELLREALITNFPLPTFDTDLLFGLLQRRPSNFYSEPLIAVPKGWSSEATSAKN